MATLVVVRHGETRWNRENRVQGWAAVGLTERGKQQANTLAATIADRYAVDRVVSSDLRRTLETARPLARAVDCEPTPDRRWRERDFGVLQGLSYGELFFGYPEYTLTEVGYIAAQTSPEGGESLLDQRERIIDAATDLGANMGEDETIVVVAHGGSLYLLLGWIKGLDIVATITEQEQGNCAINEFVVNDDDTPTVERENDTRHIDDDATGDAANSNN